MGSFHQQHNMKTFLFAVLVVLAISTVSARRGKGKPKCADGSAPTCSDDSAPVFDGDKSTPPCPDGGKPKTCADGSTLLEEDLVEDLEEDVPRKIESAVMDPPQSLMEIEAPHPVLMEPSQSVLQMIVKS